MTGPVKGIVLLLTVAILTMMALSSVAMVSVAVRFRQVAASETDAVQARLLALSGIGYASARLFEEPAAIAPATGENQSHDWTYRDGSGLPLERSLNPSYGHGEPYRDLGGNGAYDSGLDLFDDVDRNERRDAWSGRLRGRRGLLGNTFILKIAGQDARISVNGGLLGLSDLNGNGVADHCDPGVELISPPPFYKRRSIDLPENRRVALLFDALWETLFPLEGPSDPARGVAPPPPGGDASSPGGQSAWTSWVSNLPAQAPRGFDGPDLGKRIVAARPPGGYSSLEEVRVRAGVPPDRWDKIRDYLGVSAGGTVQGVLAGPDFSHYRPDRRFPVTLALADPVLLEALFRDLAGARRNVRRYLPLPKPLRAGGVFGTGNPRHWSGGSILREDLHPLVDFWISRRPFASWYEAFVELDRAKALLFPSAARQKSEAEAFNAVFVGAFGPLAALYASCTTPTVTDIQNDLVDLVFANANPDTPESRCHMPIGGVVDAITSYNDGAGTGIWACRGVPPLSWISYDLERPGRPGDPIRVERTLNKANVARSRRWDGGSPTWGLGVSNAWEYMLGSLEFSLDPAGASFSVQSLGRVSGRRFLHAARGMGATIEVAGGILARSQDDFENRGTGRYWGLPIGVSMSEGPFKDRTQSYPMFPLDSAPEGAAPVENGSPLAELRRLGSPYAGDIRLMDCSSGEAHGAAFYAPMWEKGQPFRNTVSPASWWENFQDVVAGASIAPDLEIARDWLLSGTQSHGRLTTDNRTSVDSRKGHAIPGSIPSMGEYIWGTGPNAGEPPLGTAGSMDTGTIEFWSGESAGQWSNPSLVLIVADIVLWQTLAPNGTPEIVRSVTFHSQPDWHLVAACFDGDGIALYVDGVLAGTGDFSGYPINSTQSQAWKTSPSMGETSIPAAPHDEIRLYRTKLQEESLRVHALRPRFWTSAPDLNPSSLAGIVPSYTSPLYRFHRPARLTYARWEGFVPRRIAEAVDAYGAEAPLRVELLCYDTPTPLPSEAPRWVVPFPEEFWRTGGGGIDFERMWRGGDPETAPPRISALRYRVWMDVSAVDGFNNETPVFDSIAISCRTGQVFSLVER